jgi:hypothetical protein
MITLILFVAITALFNYTLSEYLIPYVSDSKFRIAVFAVVTAILLWISVPLTLVIAALVVGATIGYKKFISK